jgi:hypothetical protein
MMKKRFLFMVLAVILCMANVSFVSAAPAQKTVDYSAFDRLTELKHSGQIKDSEVAAYLKKAGWNVANTKTITLDAKGNEINPSDISVMSTTPSNYTLTIWSTYNDRIRTEWAIYTSLHTTDYESYPASYDVFSLDWDPGVFTFRSISADTSDRWLAISKSNYGSMLFNLKDDAIFGTNITVDTYVGLTQKQPVGSPVNTSFDLNFNHTYDVTNSSTTYTGSAQINFGAPSGIGISWTTQTTTIEKYWQRASPVAIRTN